MSPLENERARSPQERSPTRRFVKPDVSYVGSDMLGAGTDPLALDGNFS